MALVAALTHEPARAEVEQLLRGQRGEPRIAAVNVGEVFDVMVRIKSWGHSRVEEAVSLLKAGGLDVVPTTEQIGRRAGDLRARLYHRTSCPLSLGDCVALATARHLGDELATADASLADAARREGVPLIPLQNSQGERPPPPPG